MVRMTPSQAMAASSTPSSLPLWAHALGRAGRARAVAGAVLCGALTTAILAALLPEHLVTGLTLAAVPLATGAWLLPRLYAGAATLAAASVPAILGAAHSLAGQHAAAAAGALLGTALLASATSELPAIARARARRTALVRRVAELAASGLPLPRILNGILAAMAREGLRGGSVALINDQDELYIAAWEGTIDRAVLDSRLPVGNGILGRVAATGRPLIVHDLDAPGRGPKPANRNLGTNAQMRSMLVVPLRVGDEVIGVLEIDSDRPHRFTRDDLAVMERIADEIAAAAHHAGPLQLANELLGRRVHELMLLEDTARSLAASLDLEVLVPSVISSAVRGLGVPYAALLRVHGGIATVLASSCDGVVDVQPREVDLRTLPMLRAAVSVGGAQSWYVDPHGFAELDRIGGRTGLRTAGCVPVTAGEEFTGVLLAASAEQRDFDPAELRLLQGVGHLAGLAIDNAESYRKLQESAATDALTGLLNRQEFDRRLSPAHSRPFAVLLVDVDRLRMINDSFGHEAGDAVLRAIAGCLRNLVGPRAALGRTSGDEFSLLVDGVGAEQAVELGEQMRRALYGVAVPFGLARISVGVAAGEPGDDAWVVRDRAGEALEGAKRHGRDRVERAVSAQAPEAASPSRRIEQAVRDLVEHGGVEAVYQPVVRLRDMCVVGYEALARPLGHPADGSVESIFAAAHRTGLARDLDWLCRRAAVQHAHGLPAGTPLFVNVGVSALLDPLHDVDQMLLVLRWARRSAREVVLEITEREVVSDLRRFEEVIATYRAQGFRFAIDDVGEGHSTLEVLAASNPEYIKVARSLTIAADRVGPLSAIHAVVAFARSSGAAIIAEGIETARHAELMADIGVDLGQGWLLGKPAPAPGNELRLPVASGPN